MDKEFWIQVLSYIIGTIIFLMLKWKYEGKEAITTEILKQELEYKERGLGALKKKAVQEFVSKLPKHIKIFIKEDTIDIIVRELQPIFKKIKGEKENGNNETNNTPII